MVRSPVAHGLIRGIDTAAARAMPGVLAVYTAADLEEGGVGPLPARQVMNNRDGTPMLMPTHYALPDDKVRYVGEAVAAVVAETVAQAKDAAEVVDDRHRPAAGGDRARACRRARRAAFCTTRCPAMSGSISILATAPRSPPPLPAAAHVTRLRLRNNRIVVNAMEPRSAIADYDRGAAALDLACRLPGRVRLSQLHRRHLWRRPRQGARC